MHYKSSLFLILSIGLFSYSSSFKPIETGIYIPNVVSSGEKKAKFDSFELNVDRIDKERYIQAQYNIFEDPYSQKMLKNEDKIFLTFDLIVYERTNDQGVKLQCHTFRLEQRYWKTLFISVDENLYGIASLTYVPLNNLLTFCYYQEDPSYLMCQY